MEQVRVPAFVHLSAVRLKVYRGSSRFAFVLIIDLANGSVSWFTTSESQDCVSSNEINLAAYLA